MPVVFDADAAALWREPAFERRMAAVEILRMAGRQLRGSDLAAVETLIRDARTWALVDSKGPFSCADLARL